MKTQTPSPPAGLLKSLAFAPPARFRRSPALWLLVWVTISGTFPVHVFVPALPDVARDLNASVSTVQLTITLYLIGISFGQLLYGPLSDRLGRRPVLIGGLTLFAAGSIGSALAGSIGMLIVARIAQALGGCGGLVLGRAILRDSVEPDVVVKRLALLGLVMSLGPALAPVVGATLAEHLGWRAIFIFLGVSNVAVLAVTVLTLPETLRAGHDRKAVSYLDSYRTLLRSRYFLRYAIGGACATTGFYAFLSASPFLLMHELGVSREVFGWLYLSLFTGLALGNVVARQMVGRLADEVALRYASVVLIAGPLLLLAAYALGQISVPTLIFPVIVVLAGTGMAGSFAVAGAISVDSRLVGSASSLYGFLQMTFGAFCTFAVAVAGNKPLPTMIVILLGAGVVAWLCFPAPEAKS